VEFKLPNDHLWREQSLKQETNNFRSQEWLNSELWRAAMGGDVNYVKELISQDANPDSTDSEWLSTLAIAARNGNEEVVRVLLDHGANVNARSGGPIGQTALMAAASNGNRLTIIRLLVDRGADVNIQGEAGLTALMGAAVEGDIESVKYLLSKGANPSLKDRDGYTAVELIKDIEIKNRVEMTKILNDAQTAGAQK
jgi:ankyrin repeat protein